MINLKVVKYMTNDNNEKNNLNKVIKKFPSNAFVMKALTLFGIIFLFIGFRASKEYAKSSVLNARTDGGILCFFFT